MQTLARFLKSGARRELGFSFIELMAASLITSVVAGGTFMAIATAARLTSTQASPQVGEAMGFAQESVEKPRNHVATDDPWFGISPGSWQDDPVSPPVGSESINQVANPAERRVCVVEEDCGGDGNNDCFRVKVKVCWKGNTAANCPAIGSTVDCP